MKLKSLLLLLLTVLACVFLGHAVAVSSNLIPNASVEKANAKNTLPVDWHHSKWGTNTASFSYQSNGYTGSRSVYINMTAHKGGAADWYFNHVTVAPNKTYAYSDYYKSNVQTEIDVEYADANGNLTYDLLGYAPANSAWTTENFSFTTPANAVSLTIFHLIDRVGWLQTDDFSLTSQASAAPPLVNFTSPANNSTVSGSVNIAATASSTAGITGVQFQIDGAAAGSEDTVAPYSYAWDTSAVINGNHTLTATVFANDGQTAIATENVDVENQAPTTPPQVNITSPANNTAVSGTVSIAASASDATGVRGVQFKANGQNIGPLLTTAPYSYSWDTTSVTNGSYSLSAEATNQAGLKTTSSPVTVSVQNQAAPPPTSNTNLIPNPSLESSANGTTPDSWTGSSWGTNSSAFTYLNSGYTGSHSVKAQMSAYTNGAADWYYPRLNVTANTVYQFSDYYQSNVATEVDAEVQMTDGSVNYYYLGSPAASSSWAQFSANFTAPPGAVSLRIYQVLAKAGFVTTDDYSLVAQAGNPSAPTFNRAIVSITFDDGWSNQYQNALPLLQKYGQTATFYIITSELTDQPSYMSLDQVKSLNSAGFEIGSHSVTHPDLTTVSQTQLVNEMQQSQATLQNDLGVPVPDFAYPYGAYNNNTRSVGSQYYQTQRTVSDGINTKSSIDFTQLLAYQVNSDISPAEVQALVDNAIAQKAWLILIYHEVANTPISPTDGLYHTVPSDLDTELAYIRSTGVAVETMHEAYLEISAQL